MEGVGRVTRDRPQRWADVVGEVGLEPTISCSQSTCVANYATPRRSTRRGRADATHHTATPRFRCVIAWREYLGASASQQGGRLHRESFTSGRSGFGFGSGGSHERPHRPADGGTDQRARGREAGGVHRHQIVGGVATDLDPFDPGDFVEATWAGHRGHDARGHEIRERRTDTPTNSGPPTAVLGGIQEDVQPSHAREYARQTAAMTRSDRVGTPSTAAPRR